MYFIATLCPPEVDAFVEEQKKILFEKYGCRNALKSPAHITIIPPFWMERAQEGKLRETLGSFSFQIREIPVQLDGFSHFSHRTLFVQVQDQPSLGLLRQTLQEHILIRMPGLFKTDDRKFHPHVTLATRDIKPGEVDRELARLSSKGYEAHYFAMDFSLMRLDDGKWREVYKKEPGRY